MMEPADGHRYFEGLAVAHVLGGLDDSKGQVFRAHLLECGDCRARVGELRAIAHDLAEAERDERRMRAAQAIDTKRRESEDEDPDLDDVPEASRASRVTVVVGLALLVGLSLWNFTLHGALKTAQHTNRNLVQAAVIQDSGTPWSTVREEGGVTGTVTVKDGRFVLTADGLDPAQVYGLYAITADSEIPASYIFQATDEGRVEQLFALPARVERILITDPGDQRPGTEPSGLTVFEARPTP